MNTTLHAQAKMKTPNRSSSAPVSGGLCGRPAGFTDKCTEVSKHRLSLQRSIRNVEIETPDLGGVPPIVHEVLRSSGQPLDAETRAFMEPRFGHDFSNVRVHTDVRAVESAHSVDAIAYTVGRDIVFGAGRYAPRHTAGQRLLAHELVHVIQQSGASENSSNALTLGDSRSASELQAESLTDQLIAAPVEDKSAGHSLSILVADAVVPGNSIIQRQVPVPQAALAVAAANFAMSMRPAGKTGLDDTSVQFRYSRSQPGPHAVKEERRMVFVMSSMKGLGSSYGTWDLVFRYDGHNILSAYTEQDTIDGYEGGAFGSEATVTFSALEASTTTEPVTGAYLLFEGLNNPSGFGFQRFAGRLLVQGDGTITPQQCRKTEGDGYARVEPFWCEVGF